MRSGTAPSAGNSMEASVEAAVLDVLSKSGLNGGPYWSRADGDMHAPAGFSTIDVINVLGDLGVRATDHPIVEKAATFVLERSDGRGGFRYTPKGGELPCLSARIAAGLRKLGVEDDRIHAAYAKFLSTQEEDGGWRCKTVRLGKSPETDASNPGTTLFVLDAFRFRANGTDDLVRLERAVEFLLGHWVTKKPLGPCAFGIGNRFASIEFPFLRYNILYFAYVLSSYPKAVADPRFAEVVAVLRAKSEGCAIRVETPHKAWERSPFAAKGLANAAASAKWAEILRNCP